MAYGDIEWKDNNYDGDAEDEALGDQLYPVCYTRSGTAHGDVKIRADIAIRVWGNPGSDLKVRASGLIGGETIDLVEATPNAHLVGGTHIQATLESQQAIPDTILYNTIDLDWQVSFDGGTTWYDVGTSNNTVYLTWDDPVGGSPLYETCVYIDCHAADGMGGVVNATNDANVLNAIWTNSFSTKSVHRVDGELLTYYGYRDNNDNGNYDPGVDDNFNNPVLCRITDTAGLLQNRNGQCHSWANDADVLSVRLDVGNSSPSISSRLTSRLL